MGPLLEDDLAGDQFWSSSGELGVFTFVDFFPLLFLPKQSSWVVPNVPFPPQPLYSSLT